MSCTDIDYQVYGVLYQSKLDVGRIPNTKVMRMSKESTSILILVRISLPMRLPSMDTVPDVEAMEVPLLKRMGKTRE